MLLTMLVSLKDSKSSNIYYFAFYYNFTHKCRQKIQGKMLSKERLKQLNVHLFVYYTDYLKNAN